MPNRLDIELTSDRGDGSYTWRAAGARQPKGLIDGKILSDTAKVGDVLRVEAEVEIDGITILAVLPPKEKASASGRIEMLGSSKPVAGVTTVLISEGGRGDRRDLLDSPRRGGGTGSRERRPARGGARPDSRRPQPGETTAEGGDRRPERRPRPDAAPGGPSSGAAAGRPARAGAERRPERRPRAEGAPGDNSSPGVSASAGAERRPRPTAGTGARPGRPGAGRDQTDARQPAGARTAQTPARRTAPRFEPGTAHRDLLFAGLAPEQRPIAERLAAGGIPGVRRAIAEERERARSEGRPEVSGDAILALAEQLAPSVKQATWLDRAEAAVAQLETISLRDLRTTVASAAPRDEAARELDRKLREELDRRIKKLRSHWEEQITHALEEGRVLQALRFSAQPPEPTARFPASLVDRLASAAGASMTASTPAERWLALLDAASASPIRRQIHPAGLPEDSTGEVVRRARLASGGLPALAPMVGLSMPPPPKPIPGAHPVRPTRPPTRPPRRPSKPAAAQKTPEGIADSGDTTSESGVAAQEPAEGSGESAVRDLDAGAASLAPLELPASDTTEGAATGEVPQDPVPSETSEDTVAEEPVTEPAPGGAPAHADDGSTPQTSADEAPRLPAPEDPGPAPADA